MRSKFAAGSIWRLLRHDRGQSIVELALAAPILVFALMGGLDLMRVAAVQQAVQNAARAGADVIGQNSATPEATVFSAINGELMGTPGLRGVSVQTCSAYTPPAPSPCVQLPDSSGGVYSGRLANGTPCTSNAIGICYVRVRVLYEFRTIVPWWFVPNRIIVDRGTSMPRLG